MSRSRLIMHGRVGTDTTPDAFTFTDVTSVPLSTAETSNTITIAGLGSGVSVAVTISGGAYSKNGGSYVSSAGTAQNGDQFAVRHTSSASNSAATNTTLTVGGVSDTFTSTTLASGSVTYNTSIGNGVGTDAFTDLPLNSTALYYFVSSATGNDANTGLSHAQALATAGAGLNKVLARAGHSDGPGDHVLLAQGTIYTEQLPSLNGMCGASKLHPTCVQSYDPADPTNTAKYGRSTDANAPKFTTSLGHAIGSGGGAYPDKPTARFVFRGIKWDPATPCGVNLLPPTTGNNSDILFENCHFPKMAIALQQQGLGSFKGRNFIFRICSFRGVWVPSGHTSPLYVDGTIGITIEDCVLYHGGWKEGASRDDDISLGGLVGDEVFRHAYYFQEDSFVLIVRRNLIADNPADGGQNRSGCVVQSNVYLNNPITAPLGGGTDYEATNPTGVDIDFGYNAAFGGNDITSAFPRGAGTSSSNGRPGSRVHHNIFAHSLNPSGVNTYVYTSEARRDIPSYMRHDHNVDYVWAVAAQEKTDTGGGFPAQIHTTYDNNIWAAATSGTNTNNGSVSIPHTYTPDDIIQIMGYSGANAAARYLAFVDDAKARPEALLARQFLTVAQAAYGTTPATLEDLSTTIRLTCGQFESSIFVGTIDGSVLSTVSGLPAGVTLNSETRSWEYDMSGTTTGSGTWVVRETLGASTHDTSISWARYVAPVLSSLSITGVTSSAATLHATTNVGNGKLYYVVTTDSGTITFPGAIKQGVDANLGFTVPAPKAGNQTVSATGAQAISVTGLTSATTYYAWLIHEDSAGTWSLIASLGSFTTS